MTKRPLDKGGAAREIELSNAMCARALGGSRKSWMIGTNGVEKTGTKSTQRKGPRRENTSMSAAPVSIAEGIPQQNRAECIASSETVSTGLPSTSFAVNPLHGPKSPEFQNVLPSPAPSEEHRQDNSCVVDLETEAEERVSNGRPVPATAITPRVSSSIEREAEPSTFRTRQEQDPMVQENVQSSSHFNSEDPPQSLTEPHGGLEEIRKYLRESDAQRAGAKGAQLPSTAGQSVAGLRNSVSFSSEPSEPNQTRQISTGATSENPASQAPRVLSDKPTSSVFVLGNTLTQFGQSITQRLNQIRRKDSLQIEAPRLMLLQEAVKKNDIFYIMLHQIYCLNFLSPMPNAAVRKGFTAIHSQGLMILSQPLLENSKLKVDVLQWFSNMPLSLERMFQVSSVFESTFAKVLAFLAQLSMHWARVKDETKLRKCPPSANEMTVMFGLQSLVLQIVLFRALLREIWSGAQDQCFNHCEKAFQCYQTASSSQLTVVENQNFYSEINRARAQHQTHIHRSGRPQSAMSQVNVPHMAPPQRRFSEATASGGHGVPVQERPLQADTRSRPTRISTTASQQASSVSPRIYTPTIPSSRSRYVSITPTDQSRMPQQHLLGDQRFRTVAPLLTNLPSVPSSTTPAATQGSNSRATTFASLGWLGGQERRAAETTMSENQLRNHPGINGGSHRPNPQTSIMAPSQVHASSRDTVQDSSNQYLYQPGNQLSSPQDNLARSTFGSLANRQIEPLYSPPPSVLVDIGKPFLRPLPTIPVSTTDQSALHQSHVASPTLRVINALPSTDDLKYFMYLERVEMCPEQLHAHKRYVKWALDLRRDDVDMLAKTIQTPVGYPSQLNAVNGSWLCRIRSVRVNNLATRFTESDWVAASNAWPSGIAILLNGKALEIRKKLHHSKDLPINITSLLQEGQNSISVAVSKIDDGSVYALAMETAQVTTTKGIRERVSRLNLPEAKASLLRYLNTTDSDVQILNPKMTLDLTDPFTSDMCCLPVRSTACKHKQCFDLEIFLLTRNGKANEPCGPDQFRCPICGADARPKNLFVDGFFVKVREELQQLGRLDVKAIVLDENGDWQIKEEEQIGESGDGTGRRKSESAAATRPSSARKESEIIDLASDD
ncbi:MAG: hypothetical protein Q9195_000731 [Heterodermia aff. obscurata]